MVVPAWHCSLSLCIARCPPAGPLLGLLTWHAQLWGSFLSASPSCASHQPTLLRPSAGVVYAAMGQQQQSQEYLKIAQQCFQLVGSSATECDTIPGRF